MKVKNIFNNKETLQEVVNKSFSKAQVLSSLGVVAAGGNYKTLDKYLSIHEIDTSHFTGKVWNQGDRFRSFGKVAELEEILVENSLYSNTSNLKKKLIDQGIKIHKCECCGLEEWLGKEIPLELDHINGINRDNRINNLRLLCPNCHAMTPTYRGRNIKPV